MDPRDGHDSPAKPLYPHVEREVADEWAEVVKFGGIEFIRDKGGWTLMSPALGR
jgi:hypothetical protein